MIDEKKLTNKISNNNLKKEIKIRTISYITAALGLVAGLAWNDAIRSLIENIFPVANKTLWAKFIYAVLITIVVVAISINLVKISSKNDKN